MMQNNKLYLSYVSFHEYKAYLLSDVRFLLNPKNTRLEHILNDLEYFFQVLYD